MSRVPDAFDRQQSEDEPDDSNVQCKFCGSRRVYWMTAMGRREAEFTSRANNNPLVMKLAKAKLYDIDGGEHVCRAEDLAKDFD